MLRRLLHTAPAAAGRMTRAVAALVVIGASITAAPITAQTGYETLRTDALRRLGAQLQSDQIAAARDSLAAYLATQPGDAVMQYNLACLLAIGGEYDAAVARLDSALAAGYRDLDRLFTDPDLVLLRDHPRLVALADSVEAALVDRMLDAQFDLLEGEWSVSRPLRPASRRLGPGPGIDAAPGSVRLRFDQQGLTFEVVPPPGGETADLTACVALPRSLDEHETDRWFEFTASLTAAGPVPLTARHGRHEVIPAAARLRRDADAWRLVIPWSSLHPYRPPVELLLGLNVTLRQPTMPTRPSHRWSLISDPFAGSRTQPWRRFAPALLDPGFDPEPVLAGRLDTYLVVGDTLSAELALQGMPGGPATITLLRGAEGDGLVPTDTLAVDLEPELAYQTVSWEVGHLPLGWFSLSARLANVATTGPGAATGGLRSALTWRDRAFRLPPDWFVEGRERAAGLPAAERSLVEYRLFQVLRGQQAFQPHDDPAAIAEAALAAERLLMAAEVLGTVLPEAATVIEGAFPTGQDALQACRLVLPGAARRAHAPAIMVVTGDREQTAAVAGALAAQRAPDDDRVFMVLTAAMRPGQPGQGVAVIRAARAWLGSLLGPSSVRMAAMGPAASMALHAAAGAADAWDGVLLVAEGSFDPWPAADPAEAARMVTPDLSGLPLDLDVPASVTPRTARLIAALEAGDGAPVTIRRNVTSTPAAPQATAARILEWSRP